LKRKCKFVVPQIIIGDLDFRRDLLGHYLAAPLTAYFCCLAKMICRKAFGVKSQTGGLRRENLKL
jgi:hypothetical protein